MNRLSYSGGHGQHNTPTLPVPLIQRLETVEETPRDQVVDLPAQTSSIAHTGLPLIETLNVEPACRGEPAPREVGLPVSTARSPHSSAQKPLACGRLLLGARTITDHSERLAGAQRTRSGIAVGLVAAFAFAAVGELHPLHMITLAKLAASAETTMAGIGSAARTDYLPDLMTIQMELIVAIVGYAVHCSIRQMSTLHRRPVHDKGGGVFLWSVEEIEQRPDLRLALQPGAPRRPGGADAAGES